MFVNNDIRKEMYKGADANVDAQFKKLYIYHMENVSILFADIKVSITVYETIVLSSPLIVINFIFYSRPHRDSPNWRAKRLHSNW